MEKSDTCKEQSGKWAIETQQNSGYSSSGDGSCSCKKGDSFVNSEKG